MGLRERNARLTIESEMIDVNVRGFAAMSVMAMNHFQDNGSGHLVAFPQWPPIHQRDSHSPIPHPKRLFLITLKV